MKVQLVADDLVLDAANTVGLRTEVSDVVTMDGHSAVQMAVLLFAVTVSELEIQLQGSIDAVNWVNLGSQEVFDSIGRRIFPVLTGVGITYVRIFFGKSKGGKAILKAWLQISTQSK